MQFLGNVLIGCDVLPLMERLDDSCVDLIYLDPFWYGKAKPEDAFPGTAELQGLFQVFQQSHRVLKNTGNLFVFLGSETRVDFHRNLREIFGVEHFVTEFIIPRRIATNIFKQRHDRILLYKKSEHSVFNKHIIRRTEQEIQTVFPNKDKKGRFRIQSLFIPSERFNFEWNGIIPPPGSSWRFSQEKLLQLMNAGLVDMKRKVPALKSYASEADVFKELGTIWADLESGANKWSKHGSKSQPVKLLERVVKLGSNEGGIVFDPYCGTGSTLIAATNLRRNFIGSDPSMYAVKEAKSRLKPLVKFEEISNNEILNNPVVWNKYYSMSSTEEDEIAEVLLEGESEQIEFKESAFWNYNTSKQDPHLFDKIAKSVVAFCNSYNGGSLIIGIRDDKSQLDLGLDFKTANPQKQDSDGHSLCINSKLTSECGPSIIGSYAIRYFSFNDNVICRIDVKPSKVPVFFKECFFVRHDNQSIKLEAESFYNYLKVRFA